MAPGQWYPPEWPDRIRALASGELKIVPPRRAATVMLLRDAPEPGAQAGSEPAGPTARAGTELGARARSVQCAGPEEPDGPNGSRPTGSEGPTGAAGTGGSASPEGPTGLTRPSGLVDPTGLTSPVRTPNSAGSTGPVRSPRPTALAGPSVHMLRRRTSMPFAAGAYAYPGGGVDPRDDDVLVGWAGPSRGEWAARLGVDEATAQAIVCAAVRETYEESGVLLAGPAPDALVRDITGADWEADRAALVAHELSFAEFLERRGLLLRSDLLGAWARWVTPEFESRRYDTWFFVAALPAGQRTARTSGEADRTVWITPAEAAARYDAGELMMLPPTIATLRELSAYGSVAEALAAAADRDLTAVMARASVENGEVVLTWPGHEEFTRHVPVAAPAEGPNTAAPNEPNTAAPARGPKIAVPGAPAGAGTGEDTE